MQNTELHVHLRMEDGSFWATVDEYPGVFATGDTLDELRESLQEGISLYLAAPGEPAPRVQLSELQPAETPASTTLALA